MWFYCTFCNVYEYDDSVGDEAAGIRPGMRPADLPSTWKCPVCGMGPEYLSAKVEVKAQGKDINYYRNIAREKLTGICGEFSVCDGAPGRTCQGQKFGAPLGLGGAGQGNTFHANYVSLHKHHLKVHLVKKHAEPDLSASVFGRRLSLPVMAPSIAGVKNSMNGAIEERDFCAGMVNGCRLAGTMGMSGNTPGVPDDMGLQVIGECGGCGIPIFKPQAQGVLIDLFRRAEKMGMSAVGVDLDGAGSVTWARVGRPVFRKSPAELRELVDCTKLPVIFKGIMSREDADGVADAKASCIYVSNHGGRVLDNGLGVAEVLPGIAKDHKGRVLIMADGCVRTGYDVLVMLALGADIALIGRPLARMSLAGGAEAVRLYLEYVRSDLRLAMLMTGCDSLADVNGSILENG